METNFGMCNSLWRVVRAIFVGMSLLLAAPALRAEAQPRFHVAAHAAYRVGGSLEDLATGDDRDFADGAGLAVALELRYRPGDDRFYQIWYSRQPSEVNDGATAEDVDIEYLHLGGTIPIGEHERAQPYFAAGLGLTRFTSPAAGSNDKTRFSGSIAFGVAWPVAERVALRLEARGYLTAVDADSAIFCRSDNGSGFCRIAASGSSIFQAEALAGIAFSF